MAAHSTFHQHLNDEHTIDFVGAFEDPVNARIAIGAADRIIFVETVTTEDLHAFVHSEIEHFAAIDLRDRAFYCIFFEHFHGVLYAVARSVSGVHGGFHVPRTAVHHRLDRENLYGYFSEFFLDQAKVCDLLPECFALLGVFGSSHQHILGAADARSAQSEAARVQHIESDNVAPADFV